MFLATGFPQVLHKGWDGHWRAGGKSHSDTVIMQVLFLKKKHIISPRNIVWFLDPASMSFFSFLWFSMSQKSAILYFLIGLSKDLRSVSTHCSLSLCRSTSFSLSFFHSGTESSGGDVFCSEALQWHDERGSAARLWGMAPDSGCGLKLSVCGNSESDSDPLKQGFPNWGLQRKKLH